MAPDDIAPDDIALDDIAIDPEVIASEVMALDVAAAVLLAAAAEVLLLAVPELDPQAASVRAMVTPVTRTTARFINTCAP
ncbi:MAG: hypothetical protein ABJD68_00990 [Nakamurella sp.]